MSVNIIDTLKPKNNGTFPIVEAVDVAVTSDLRLPEALEAKADASALAETNAAVEAKANASDVSTATANLQGQINQIEISASAEAVVAPEVAAARVGDDGTEYATLKSRLDTENLSLQDDIASVGSNIGDITELGTPVRTSTVDAINSLIVVDQSENIADKSQFEDGYYARRTSGTPAENASYCCTNRIKVTPGKYYACAFAVYNSGFYCFYTRDDDSSYIPDLPATLIDNNGGTRNDWAYFQIPNNVNYIRLSITPVASKNKMMLIDVESISDLDNISPTAYIPYHRTVSLIGQNDIIEDIGDLDELETDVKTSTVDAINSFIIIDASINIANVELFEDGYYARRTNGTPAENANYCCTNRIPVEPGSFYACVNAIYEQAFYCFYSEDSDSSTVSSSDTSLIDNNGGVRNGWAYFQVPDNAHYLRLSMTPVANKNKMMLIKVDNIEDLDDIPTTPFIPYKYDKLLKGEPEIWEKVNENTDDISAINDEIDVINDIIGVSRKNPMLLYRSDTYTEEVAFTDFKTSLKSTRQSVVVNLGDSFTSITIGLSDGTKALFSATVTDTQLIVFDYGYASPGTTTTLNHGLTIENDVCIEIEPVLNTGRVYVIVTSNGTSYKTASNYAVTHAGIAYPYFSMVGTATFVQFCAIASAIKKDIWMFGDSYFGNESSRWMYYLITNKYADKCLIDAYGGENSSASLTSLTNLLAHGTPKYIVWCLGMNDASDSGTTPNSTWLEKIESVLSLCSQAGATPILATIPSVPSKSHEGKNTWIRSSEYQYIDFAKAVGAQSDGTWFEGMLSQDNVHPTAEGAKALYCEAVTAFPLLTCD